MHPLHRPYFPFLPSNRPHTYTGRFRTLVRTRPHSYQLQERTGLSIVLCFHTVYASSTIIHASSNLYTDRTIYPSDLTRLSIDVKLSVEPDFHVSRIVRNSLGYVMDMSMEVPFCQKLTYFATLVIVQYVLWCMWCMW